MENNRTQKEARVRSSRLLLVSILVVITFLAAWLAVLRCWPVQAQDSATDSLTQPPLTATHSLTQANDQANPPEATVWTARLVEVIPNAVLGGGAIVRVYVKDRPAELLHIRLDDYVIENKTGTKPEFGPNAAEFAPLQPGQWIVSVPNLDASLAVQTDDRSLFIVEFYPVPAAQATAEASGPDVTATPQGGALWEGRQTGVVSGPSVAGALLRVTVEGLPGTPVDITTFTDFIGQGVTGSKPELPADVVEFAGLSEGRYTITPHGLNTQLTIDLVPNTTTFVEFRRAPSPPSPTPSPPQPPTATPRPLPSPTPTATPPQRWFPVAERLPQPEQVAPKLIVRVEKSEPETVTVVQHQPALVKQCTTSRSSSGQFECEIEGLLPGVHTARWEQAGLSTPIWLQASQVTVLTFKAEALPAEKTTWQATLMHNTNGPRPLGNQGSTIDVRLGNRPGQIISLTNSRGQMRLCEVDLDGLCRFDRLGAGVYTVALAALPARYDLYVDGQGEAAVEFAEAILSPEAESVHQEAITGMGANPRRAQSGIGIITATPTATPSASATLPPTPTPRRSPTPTLRPRPPATATFTPTPAPSPTPAMAWLGRVSEDLEHAGQTIVVRAPFHDQPIILKSGDWQIEGRTGTKPEYGDGAVEFAGLGPGQYTISLVGLGETTVTLKANNFLLVDFVYELAPTPTPTPKPGQWAAAIISNTSGSSNASGAWSIITVEVGGYVNHPIRISTDGFETECITGTKPELGDAVCEIGGLWPGTYRVQPVGLPISINVTVDGSGVAWVAFWQQ